MAPTKNTVNEVLEEIAADQNFKNYRIEVSEVSTGGANYSSALYKAVVISSSKDDLHLFIKVASWSQSLRAQVNLDDIYRLEPHFYENMVPAYKEIQNKFNIPRDEQFVFPKYYGSKTRYMEETVVLENLEARGFELYDRMKVVDWEYASSAVQEIAKFHALSIVYEHQYAEKYAKDVAPFGTLLVEVIKEMKESFKGNADCVQAVVPQEWKQRIQNFVLENWTDEKIMKYYGSGKASSRCIIHGDYRASNIMYKRQNGKVTSLVPVDYQTMHLGSPTIDLIFFIYCGTDAEFRRKHLSELLDLYYGTFSTWLHKMSMNPEKCISRKDFDEDFKDNLVYGLVVTIVMLPVVLVDPSSTPQVDLEGSGLSTFTVPPTQQYLARLMPTLQEYALRGMI